MKKIFKYIFGFSVIIGSSPLIISATESGKQKIVFGKNEYLKMYEPYYRKMGMWDIVKKLNDIKTKNQYINHRVNVGVIEVGSEFYKSNYKLGFLSLNNPYEPDRVSLVEFHDRKINEVFTKHALSVVSTIGTKGGINPGAYIYYAHKQNDRNFSERL
ncbi:hypothetical protein [Mycoplasma nasistruthionis]|uniref:Uncharacterized protein n=1 Tax=Mycoplasma nasistruthionis TaxID=353852 RepID=A0A5B7XU90_9MOLU|nr:hypothetical protein [Mycoplasma nasistruthionis]QCZ36428.1 hypothetical protein FG904_00075 [Mycoplasma nasistruthionis]